MLPAWVAEMDYALAEPVWRRCTGGRRGRFGYPPSRSGGIGDAYAGFARDISPRPSTPHHVLPVVDVTAASAWCSTCSRDPGPVVLPVPAYPPQHGIGADHRPRALGSAARPRVPHRSSTSTGSTLSSATARARSCSPTPTTRWGRVFSRPELEGIRDVVSWHGGRVVSDEVHGPLVLPGAEHVPYLPLDGTPDHAVALLSASKAFNTAGLRCAQIARPRPPPRGAARRPAGPQRLLVTARGGAASRRTPTATLAGGTRGPPRRAAHLPRVALEEHLPGRGRDRSRRLPSLDRPPRLRPRRPGEDREEVRTGPGLGGSGSSTSRTCPATSGSTSRNLGRAPHRDRAADGGRARWVTRRSGPRRHAGPGAGVGHQRNLERLLLTDEPPLDPGGDGCEQQVGARRRAPPPRSLSAPGSGTRCRSACRWP